MMDWSEWIHEILRTVWARAMSADEALDEILEGSASVSPPPGAQWQPIETAPKDGTEVLAIGDGWESEQRIRYSAPGDGVPPYWEFCESLLSDAVAAADPTHWIPLPEPPEADNE